MTGALWGGVSGALAGGIGSLAETYKSWKYIELARWSAHGARGGLVAFGQGGNLEAGFLAGFGSSMVGSRVNFNPDGFDARDVMVAAIVGGSASKLGGGKFESGAITGAFGKLLNDYMHLLKKDGVVGHAAQLIQDPKDRNVWHLRSFGPGDDWKKWFSWGGAKDNLQQERFNSLADAISFVKKEGYDSWAFFKTSASQDAIMLESVDRRWDNANYFLVGNSCYTSVRTTQNAGGVQTGFWRSIIPTLDYKFIKDNALGARDF